MGLYGDSRRQSPLANILAVATNESHVALYGIGREFSFNIHLKLSCCQAGNLTASHHSNRIDIQGPFHDTSDVWEVLIANHMKFPRW